MNEELQTRILNEVNDHLKVMACVNNFSNRELAARCLTLRDDDLEVVSIAKAKLSSYVGDKLTWWDAPKKIKKTLIQYAKAWLVTEF